MSTKAAEYRRRLHLLIYDEPHPETLESFDRQVRWQPQALPQTFLRLFRRVTSDLTTVQRLLVKLSLKMTLTSYDAMFLRNLHEQGRYRCDQEPEVFLFCVGRQGGKSTVAARTAYLQSYIQSTAVWVPSKRFENNFVWNFAPDFGDLPEVNVLNSHNCVGRPEAFHVLDEMLLMQDWFNLVSQRRNSRVVSFFSLTEPCVIPTLGRPCMALSLESQVVHPGTNSPHAGLARQIEHTPPPVDEWFHHSWGQNGG